MDDDLDISFNPAPHYETLSLEEAACLMRLGVDATRELITVGELPAASLNRKHLVLLREHVLEYPSEVARQQQRERKGRWAASQQIAPPVPRRRGRPRKLL